MDNTPPSYQLVVTINVPVEFKRYGIIPVFYKQIIIATRHWNGTLITHKANNTANRLVLTHHKALGHRTLYTRLTTAKVRLKARLI